MSVEAKSIAVLALFVAGSMAAQVPSAATPSPNSTPSQTITSPNPSSNARQNYVGDEACTRCHEGIAGTFHRTAHSLTSRLPTKDSILGNFSPDANLLKTKNPDLFFRMEARSDGFFQTAVDGIEPYTTNRTERFGLVVGSGGKGQTFLFWKGDLLFQLPVSYWKEVGWVNSPGYTDGVAYFDRAVNPRCLECHATYFESQSPPPNRYSKTGAVTGITCEKCHGPGLKHAQRHLSKTTDIGPDSEILNPARFSRERQLDLCAWCHAGQGTPILPSFSYLPGETLDRYLDLPKPDPELPIDVHGSQIELLKKSRCFRSSTMTCLTCHDVHVQPDSPESFSKICLSCHRLEAHPALSQPVAKNCIDCHMPKQHTSLIVFDSDGRKASPEVRNHWIKIYH